MRRSTLTRGFTLLELMIVVAIFGIMATIGGTRLLEALPGYRTNSAARRFLADLRTAPAIAARTNLRFTVTFSDNDPTCPATRDGRRPGYTGATNNPLAPAGLQTTQYFRSCLAAEYGGVTVAAVGPGGQLSCGAVANEAALEATAPASGCTMCGGGPTQLTFLPSGELTLPAGASVTFIPATDLAPLAVSRLLAVGISPVTGRARLYRANNAGNGWECP